MKTATKLILFLFLFTSIGCSKYEEGSFFTLRTKKARITNTWIPVKYVYPNGSSSTNVDEGEITLSKDMTATWKLMFNNEMYTVPGSWKFIGDKQGINVTVSVFNFTESQDFEIVKLKSKKLWVRDSDGVVTHFEAK
ncbi:hypothetical protein [Brumimicrobium sp.]|uniref:hypothetical protein n=1 Tax=Brumimicrobium sp. TaxID=2029867 RepID=UPI0026224C09|nr:hypothetical protein [uncultured Brumimicrobium sp.]